MPSRRLVISAMPFALLGTPCLVRASEDRPLVVGILNQQTPTKTAERWNPILRYLSDVSGIPLQMRMGSTVAETNAMMGRGEFDLVFTNHNFRKEYDGVYRVLAKWQEKPIYGVIAVRADAAAKSLKDLQGKRVAFPSKTAFVAYAVPMAALKAARVDVEPVFSAHQEGALAQLKARQVDAAAVNSRFLTQYAAQQGLQYREIFTSQGFSDLPMAVHPRVAAQQAEALRRAMLGMAKDPKASTALAAGNFEGFVAASEREYDKARAVYRLIDE